MTRKLYHEDAYCLTFSAPVIKQIEGAGRSGLILAHTAFYPTSGGQPHDLGTLNGVAVTEVSEDDVGQIVHWLAQPLRAAVVEGQIQWARRFDHMQQHTGQHLLSQAFIQVCQAETVSFHLGDEVATIDVACAALGEGVINAVEARANQIIYANRPVSAHLVRRDELQRFPLRKPPVVETNIRIIEIEDFDFSPCGGTHCKQTGEIGMIKIRKWEAYKGGTRIQFVCGGRALKDYQQKTKVLRQLSEMFSSSEAELPPNLWKVQEELKALRREQAYLTKQLLEYEAVELLNAREDVGGWAILQKIFPNRSVNDLKTLANNVLERSPRTIILFGAKTEEKATVLFLRSPDVPVDMRRLVQNACQLLEGKGGGQPQQAQGGGTNVAKLAEALQQAYNAVIAEH
jgi:alanyl-tRNA synthetase